MKFGAAPQRAPVADRAGRRLLGGLLVSLLLHGVILLLQFGVPGIGTPGATPPLTVRIANADPAPAEQSVEPPPAPPADSSNVAANVAPPPLSGMRMVDPVPAPAPPAPPPSAKAKPKVKQDKPRRARRISPPLPALDMLDEPTKVITQDSTLNDFAMPVVRPEEAEQKTVDIKDAQAGEDDGDAVDTAALEAEAAKAGRFKAEQEALSQRQAEEHARIAAQESARLAELDQQRAAALLEQQARQVAEAQAAQQRAQQAATEQQNREVLRAQQSEQLRAEQQKAEQIQAEQQKAERSRAEQQKLEQQRAELQRLEQQRAEQQKAELQKAEQQQLAQRAEQQKLEQQRAEQQKLEQQRAEQQKLEQQRAERQKAEQQRAEQQKAEQQRAEQKAEQQRAEQQGAQREATRSAAREPDAFQPGSGGSGTRSAGPGGAGATGAPGQIPRNMMGSDLANRARDMVKGLDVLTGDPPGGRAREGRRVAVGANERDLPLRMYAESWRQKIERNASVNFPRNWVDEEKKDPLVSVAVRSDGSVEDVTIITSSGRADMDEAVRRIVRVNARYSPFPVEIAKKYDVIDIRRIWRFDEALKLMEEVR